MATIKLYHDRRSAKDGNAAPVKLSINHGGKSALLSLDVKIRPEEWDNTLCKVVNHPQKDMLNVYLAQKNVDAEAVVLSLRISGKITMMSAVDIKKEIERTIFVKGDGEGNDVAETFGERFLAFANRKKGGTHSVYMQTYSRLVAFMGEDMLMSLRFEDINNSWLYRFDNFMAETAPSRNARNIHLRNIRAVFNDAIDDEITAHYPFRRFKIKPEQTAKRSLTVEQLRTLFNAETQEHATKYLDMFKLIFYLIGINTTDLCNLTELRNGRIEYRRAKTHRLYSIKVEPEAMELIEKYRGEKHLLYMLDRYKTGVDYSRHLNRELKRIGDVRREGRGGKKVFTPLFPELTTYWARHTWATIAAELEIPKETISAALGHEIGSSTTAIYIDFNQKKVDEANRKVLDWVLYGKR